MVEKFFSNTFSGVKRSTAQFLRYGLIGLANTGIHFCVFWLIFIYLDSQAVGNLCGFLVAVSFSFFMNSRFTFKKQPTIGRFIKMALLMSGLSYGSGFVGDSLNVHPIVTFVGYSALSYIIGFLLTKNFVFSE